MPRKLSYNIDYDDIWDEEDRDYGDEDYYEEDIAQSHSKSYNETKAENSEIQGGVRCEVWRCHICTYDNEEGMNFCDICGCLRYPMVKASNKNEEESVDNLCKNYGVSKLAKSLFASPSKPPPKRDIVIEQQGDSHVIEEGLDLQKKGNIHGKFLNVFEPSRVYINKHINIVPFQFNAPSPDDIVTNGLASKNKIQGHPAKVPTKDKKISNSSTGSDKTTTESLKVSSNTSEYSASVTKGKTDIKGKKNKSTDETSHENVISQMNNVSIVDKAEPSKKEAINGQKAAPREKYVPEKWVTPVQEEENTLTPLNIAIVGHVDSGKSTLSGRILHLSGRISEKQMHKFRKEANMEGKGSFAYAWAMDESAEERERGITMTVAVAYFDTKRYNVVLLDAPGHKDFVPNMISGATQADAAVLVVDASIGAFEAGMENVSGQGQTKEHAQLIRSFGNDQLIVAVNKMDIVGYSKERFEMIKTQVGTFLRACGFKDSCISWIPVSAIENENLFAAASDARLISWYEGPYLLDAIDSLKPPKRDISNPLLMPICDVSRAPSGQTSISGKLEAGALRTGMKVLIMPIKEVAMVRSLERDSQACKIARAGDNVAVTLQGIDGGYVMPGGVICHPDYPISVSNHLELKILVLNIATPILMGSQVEFHIHHVKEAATVSRIVSLLDPKTGKVTRKSPRCLVAKQSAVVEVILSEAICVEEFSKCRALGRVFLRSSGTTLAVGVVSRVIDDDMKD